ncbi:MAG: 2-oxoacid:ferredoxin oxidoreductase subunit beta [Gemmatimonadota bacterium]|jgi:2-oxoglutarate ferredoxin oxidoreductase subunit beta|nr:2-oxoacid:ferredoxin oxidoreductase subunit beta [Gemmatimonadota bacterium]MDP6460272.1 2-oxoacid:ferredoxin oxidoreductase subunit beta [Gemmatimonadota bacterium]MDP6528724.1 2-oxoacid:ferredoxin oxidoreductase subunit beta [Gemmatimonadota bacterium]MDP6802223.1 2-oxoacid:ferredoxin oxidoreductase subunit beta [Gemmatimonadota bacterium]MDP7032144.1 2-oxoacid:ferredoxin oxidoreductase subunit beta [Gemmatimonadota bacterium]
MTDQANGSAPLVKKDFVSNQAIRWCPGCGDYSILSAVQNILPTLGIPREDFVFVSGIGCSSRFPYYLKTYGFHGIHGRAAAIASGVKIANPNLSVWVASGDGDSLAIGGNHLIHTLRRNVDINILMFNNRIYGLTKGQYSPTSEYGKRTRSSPYGTVDPPFNPILLALGSGATFVARTTDVSGQHLKETLARAQAHRGTSFVEIYQNCNIFNNGAFKSITERAHRKDTQVELAHGKPLVFGSEENKGLRFQSRDLEIVDIPESGNQTDGLFVHDEKAPSVAMASMLASLQPPDFPLPIGVFRAVEAPTFDAAMADQIATVTAAEGPGKLEDLLEQGDVWEI